MATVDVLVVGAGPAGLAAARAAARVGRSVTVLDDNGREAAAAGSGLTLWPNALEALCSLGVGGVARAAQTCAGMRTARPDGSVLQYLDAATMDARCGGNGVAIRRAELMAELMVGLTSPPLPAPVEVVPGALQAVLDTGAAGPVQVVVGGVVRTARVLVGADGARSTVRAALYGVADRPQRAAMRVLRGLSDLDLGPYPAELVLGRGLQFGVFPLRRGTYWFAAHPRRRVGGTSAATVEALFGHWHHPVGALIRSTPVDRLLTHDVEDRRPSVAPWGRHRVTLVGDAAHLAAPTMGQGTGHAFEDAVALGDALAHGLDAAALRFYETARAPRAAAMVRQAHLAAVTGIWSNAAVCGLRDAAMRLTPVSWQVRALRDMFDHQRLPGQPRGGPEQAERRP